MRGWEQGVCLCGFRSLRLKVQGGLVALVIGEERCFDTGKALISGSEMFFHRLRFVEPIVEEKFFASVFFYEYGMMCFRTGSLTFDAFSCAIVTVLPAAFLYHLKTIPQSVTIFITPIPY